MAKTVKSQEDSVVDDILEGFDNEEFEKNDTRNDSNGAVNVVNTGNDENNNTIRVDRTKYVAPPSTAEIKAKIKELKKLGYTAIQISETTKLSYLVIKRFF